ncbi:MAG: ribose-phosphate diphosphokinase [Candidatus Micrarchaeota archaeon]
MGKKSGGDVGIVSQNCADFATPNVVLKKFPDGENYCRLENAEEIRGNNVRILHRLYPNPDDSIIALMQIIYGVKKSGAENISLIIPYLPYARADKVWLGGEVESARMLVKMLVCGGAKKMFVWDCHFLKKEGEFEFEGMKIENKCVGQKLVQYLKKTSKDAVVVGPDMGAKHMAGKCGKVMKKRRGEYAEEKSAFRPVVEMEAYFDVKEKEVILIDDMIAGGGTMVNATKKCFEMGAKKVHCAATHGLFLGEAIGKIKGAGVGKIVVTDSILGETERMSLKEEIVGLLGGKK